MKTLLALVLVIALAFGLYWIFSNRNTGELQRAGDQVVQGAEEVGSTVRDKAEELSERAPEVRERMESAGRAIREKAEEMRPVITDAAAEARTTAAIKAKLVQDPALSALRISVDTTDGVVTLSGSVDSAAQIERAKQLALETEGVREVKSTLQVTPRE